MHLTLLIPELVWSNPDDRNVYDVINASALTPLLGRAMLAVAPQQAGDEWLARRCGYGFNAVPPPLAALRGVGDGSDPGSDDWICADPVHLRFHQERLILADASQLDIGGDESAQLLASLNENFADLGDFVATGPARWALRLRQPVTKSWPPLAQAVGREVRVDTMLADPLLKRLGHEVQMLLHAHPVNRAREDQGRLTINALWFWGSGALPAPAPQSAVRLFSATPLARGLARQGGLPVAPPPAGLGELLKTASRGDVVVELDSLLHPASFENAADYLDAWQRLDRDWFAGLASALRRGRIRRLEIVAPSAYGLLTWSLWRLAAWKFWARRGTLSARLAAIVEREHR